MIEFENNSASSIVVCIDTFNPSEEALRYSCIKAVKNNLKLHILVVIDVAEKNLIFGAKVIENQKREKIEKKISKSFFFLVTYEVRLVRRSFCFTSQSRTSTSPIYPLGLRLGVCLTSQLGPGRSPCCWGHA